ncbi:hypothetical protein FRX31_009810 [Thalictrum thalictroides]|uniref:Uncharacterized protein n=1 Tax=Thalictrum thalictroides TaxID=46969 RepID=A0A7J6WT67_THATH|nr:hypothetical protein FRX31_009810 [Thalictrum thalictroides]
MQFSMFREGDGGENCASKDSLIIKMHFIRFIIIGAKLQNILNKERPNLGAAAASKATALAGLINA